MSKPFDEDIKIAGKEKKNPDELAKNEVENAYNELEQAKKDGNLNTAKQIGHKMADDIYKGNFPLSDNPDERVQGIFLLMFAVTVGCERYMPGSALARITLNIFNNDLEQLLPDIFAGSRYSTAMSFYYLAIRSVFHLEKEISDSYAMLCGKEGDEKTAAEGLSLFNSCIDRLEKLIRDLKF